MIVDLFAGGGGASLGIEWALGRSPDIAVNHDAEAVAMHARNHPNTRHLCGSVWHYAPRDVTGGRAVELLWASPTCVFFSRAKGGPLDRREATKVRSLAWVVTRWAREVRPETILLENVEAFATWGPLLNDGKPCPARRGRTFRRWVRSLEAEGYSVEWRELRACDYGAPTSRKRLFVVARLGAAPAWPTQTHGLSVIGQPPWRSAAECIDFTLPVPSIFGRSKPLAEATLRRIARGIERFVVGSRDPFIVPTATGAAIAPALIHVSNGERQGQDPRIYDIQRPLGTVVAGGVKHALAVAFLEKAFGGHESPGLDLGSPLGTVTTTDHHRLVELKLGADRREDVVAFLTKFYGTSTGQDPRAPLGTVTSGGWKHGLVTVRGQDFVIADIGLRMLTPRELARAQGFPDTYELADVGLAKPLSASAQVRMIGNSVCPHVAAALARANVGAAARRAA